MRSSPLLRTDIDTRLDTVDMQVQAAAPSSPAQTNTAPQPSDLQDKSWIASTSAIAPEHDPNPSWIFYPPSATYIPPSLACTSTTGASSPPPTLPSSPSRSPRSSPPPGNDATIGIGSSSSAGSASASVPSTHHRILDHCFHLSIETRLKQAEAQYLASTQEQALEQEIEKQDQNQDQDKATASALKQDDWRKRQRSLVDEAVVLGRKGSNVEAIVDGILKSHRSNGPLQTLPRSLKHRLHLCQLTSMVFGRFDVASSTNNSAGLNVYSAFHSRRHGASRAAYKHRFSHSEQGKLLQPLFAHTIPASSYCRRHHHKECKRTCCTLAKLQQEQQQALELKKKMANNYYMNNVRKQEHQRVTGLVDAIPAFLKCSAMSYRDIAKAMVDKGELEDMKGTRVLEGWYRLLLEMMTQAAIESYLCDEDSGCDTILDVFSYGDDPDNETVLKDFKLEKSAESSEETSSSSSTMTGVEGLQFQSLNSLGSTSMSSLKGQYPHQQPSNSSAMLHDVTTQDRQDDILFAKTPAYESFKKAKDERMQEFLTLNGATMEQHFADLAAKYPLIIFERQMTHFIARSQQLLVDPKLSQTVAPMGLLIPPTTSAYADGSLSMPVSEDEDEDEDMEEPRTKLEEIKEEDENDTVGEQNSRQQHFPSPPASVVVIKEEKLNGSQTHDDDDNSTAARVVQVSKKHKHHAESSAHTVDLNETQDDEHASKKARV